MKITSWLGLSTAISNYASPTGSAVEQTNLQLLLPGQATPRPALSTLVNKQDGSFIFGLYRKTNGLAVEDTVISYMRSFDPTEYYLTRTGIETLDTTDPNSEEIRILRVLTELTNGGDYYPSFCEDRHGNVYTFFGFGIRPLVVESQSFATNQIGVDAPEQAPSVTASGSGQFVERIDVLTGGGSYWAAPTISIESTAGSFLRQAKARAIVENGLVVGVEMLDHGTGYTRAPVVTAVEGKKGRGFSARCAVEVVAASFGHSQFKFYDPERDGETPGTELPIAEDNSPTYSSSIGGILDNYDLRLIGDGSGETGYTGTLSEITGVATHRVTSSTPFPHMVGDIVECEFAQAGLATVTETVKILAVSKAGADYRFDIAPTLLDGHTNATVTFRHAEGSHTHASVSSTESNAKFARVELAAIAPLADADTGKRFFNGTSISAIDTTTNTITLSHWTQTGEMEVGFKSEDSHFALGVGQLILTYDHDHDNDDSTATRPYIFAYRVVEEGANLVDDKFTATGSLSGGGGSGATAFVEFEAVDNQFQARIAETENTIQTFSDTYYSNDYQNWGLQAHPSQFKWGWQNRINDHRSCDFYLFFTSCYYDGWTYRAYFPDYRRVTVWLHTGPDGQYGQQHWTPVGVPVQVDGTGPYADVEVTPSLLADGTSPVPVSGSTNPVVRLRFEYAPSSWDRTWVGRWLGSFYAGADDDIGTMIHRPTYSGSAARADWWRNKEGNTARPLVNVTSATLINSGSGLPPETRFRLRVCQAKANAEHQVGPVGAGSSPPRTVAVSHAVRDFATYYYDLRIDNTQPTASGPGKTLGDVTETRVVSAGTGYPQGGGSVLQLAQRSKAGQAYKFSRYYSYSVVQLTEANILDSIGTVTVLSQGQDYYAPPTLFETPSPGYGVQAVPVIDTTGKITAVTIKNLQGGSGYEQGKEPFLVTSDDDATLVPVMRPVMQGVYRCTYRFADLSRTVAGEATLVGSAGSKTATLDWSGERDVLLDAVLDAEGLPPGIEVRSARLSSGTLYDITLSNELLADFSGEVIVRDMSKPVFYSNFAPIQDLDTGPTAERASTGEIIWSIPALNIPPRVDRIELLRTSGDQSLVFYRVQAYGKVTGDSVVVVGTDRLNDEELFDTSRSHYAAVPIVLPNGGLNAYRFGVARDDCSICCSFQDRLWFAGSTSGEAVNTVFFSEFDEYESCPPQNEIPIQNNQRVTDYVTALVPYGSVLLVMQSSHAYQLSYNTDPAIDAAVNLIANRGVLNHRCWDLFDDVLYAVDERGVYKMQRSGQVTDLSEAIADVFVEGQIDFTKSDACHLKIDRKQRLLRVFVVTSDGGQEPDLAYCYSLAYGTWWKETYPTSLTCSTTYKRWDTGREEPLYGTMDGTLRVFEGTKELPYRSVKTITLLDGGSGYTSPPKVVAEGGIGAELRAVIRDGIVTEIEILSRGFGFGQAPDSETFAPSIFISIDRPPSGGERASAVGSAYYPEFVTPKVVDESVVPPVLVENPETTRLTVGWSFKTPNLELITDANVKGGEQQIDRSITLTYQPTAGASVITLKHFYNNSENPRQNVMPRDRGTGWKHIEDSTRTELDMDTARVPLGHATGVAQARFANRVYADMGGADRHLAIELTQPSFVVEGDATVATAMLYSYEINGVVSREQ